MMGRRSTEVMMKVTLGVGIPRGVWWAQIILGSLRGQTGYGYAHEESSKVNLTIPLSVGSRGTLGHISIVATSILSQLHLGRKILPVTERRHDQKAMKEC
jgi:hypothetical protein